MATQSPPIDLSTTTQRGSDTRNLGPPKGRRRCGPFPAWARMVNQAFAMPLITRMDKSHLHALSASVWLFGSYGTLLHTWFAEASSGDWSQFFACESFMQILLMSGVLMSVTGQPMTPKTARFANYGKQMRNSMVSAAVQAWVVEVILLRCDGHFPQLLQTPSELLALLAMGLLGWDAVVEGRPWNIEVVIDDLKLARPPPVAMHGAMLISLAYMVLQAMGLYHVIANDAAGNSPFAAQMAFSLAVTPATEALIGTLMQKDRYTKKHGQHVWLHENEDGSFRPSHRLEAGQLLLSAPGPYLMTLALGLVQNPADVCAWLGV